MNWTALLAGAGGPVLAAIFGVAGVVLGRYIAQGIHKDGEEKLSSRANIALTILFALFVVAYVMHEPTADPLHMLGYSSVAGFIGLPILELAADQFASRFRAGMVAFMNPSEEARINKALKKLDKLPETPTDGPSD